MTRRYRWGRVAALVAGLGIAAPACLEDAPVDQIGAEDGEPDDPEPSVPTVQSVTVSPPIAMVAVGESVALLANAVSNLGGPVVDRPVIWTSADAAIAIVDQAGVVVGVAPGTTTIQATVDTAVAAATITVTQQGVAAVQLVPNQLNLNVGDRSQIMASVYAADSTLLSDRPVTWTSGAPAIAAVDALGQVTALAPGHAAITAMVEAQIATAMVHVAPPPVAVIDLVPPAASMIVGETTQFAASPKAGDGVLLPDRGVSWSSTDPAVISVSKTGLVTALAPGMARVQATSETVTVAADIDVEVRPVHEVRVEPDAKTLELGDTLKLAATVLAKDGTQLDDRRIEWTSSNPAVASVGSSGHVTTLTTGSALITAEAESVIGTCSVTVEPRRLTGHWRGSFYLDGTELVMDYKLREPNIGTLEGSAKTLLAGEVVFDNGTVFGSRSGTSVQFDTKFPEFQPFKFVGEVSADANVIPGVIDGSGIENAPITLIRQGSYTASEPADLDDFDDAVEPFVHGLRAEIR